MNKEEANKRLDALKKEYEMLREIINEPDPEPQCGEVWEDDCDGSIYFIDDKGASRLAYCGNIPPCRMISTVGSDPTDMTRLGTFDEVFVRRDKVRPSEPYCFYDSLIYAIKLGRDLSSHLHKPTLDWMEERINQILHEPKED